MSTDVQQKKLKAIKDGDNVRIGGEVFQVNAVKPQEGSRNIKLELKGHDGGSVTFIGLPKAKVQLAARAS
jgi:hypothetical protein